MKTLVIAAALALGLGFFQCGGGRDNPRPRPTPAPTATPAPHPTAEPTPEATPSPTPVATPAPSPEPSPSPSPEATPSPTPAATPSPTPPPSAPEPPPVVTDFRPHNPTPGPTPFPEAERCRTGEHLEARRAANEKRGLRLALLSTEDVGRDVMACMNRAGVREVVVTRGGPQHTTVVVGPGQMLTVPSGVEVRPDTAETPVLVKSGGRVRGEDWTATWYESTAPGVFAVIGAYEGSTVNGRGDSDILIHGLRIRGANPGFDSVRQAVELRNCRRCTLDNVWLDRTRSIGAQLGGSAQFGLHAEDSRLVNNLLTGTASQGLAVVNGRRNLVENNRILRPGQVGGPGATSIDLEANWVDDVLVDNVVRRNLIDHRLSEVLTTSTGNGIVVNLADAFECRGNLIEDNVIVGGGFEPIPEIGPGLTLTNRMSNALYFFGPNLRGGVVARRNLVWRTGQSCFRLEGANLVLEDNRCVDVGGGGTAGGVVAGSGHTVRRNPFLWSGAGPRDERIELSGADHAVEGNAGFTVVRDGR